MCVCVCLLRFRFRCGSSFSPEEKTFVWNLLKTLSLIPQCPQDERERERKWAGFELVFEWVLHGALAVFISWMNLPKMRGLSGSAERRAARGFSFWLWESCVFVVASSCFPFVRVLGVALGFNVMPLGPGKYLVTVALVVVFVALRQRQWQRRQQQQWKRFFFAISSSLNRLFL